MVNQALVSLVADDFVFGPNNIQGVPYASSYLYVSEYSYPFLIQSNQSVFAYPTYRINNINNNASHKMVLRANRINYHFVGNRKDDCTHQFYRKFMLCFLDNT